ncbi:MAG: hypothetical protein AAF391_11110 [Bacteroidota bacterium]
MLLVLIKYEVLKGKIQYLKEVGSNWIALENNFRTQRMVVVCPMDRI